MQKCFRSLLGEAQNVMEMDAVLERGFSLEIYDGKFLLMYAKLRVILLSNKCPLFVPLDILQKGLSLLMRHF